MQHQIIVLALAVLIDLVLGEPPTSLHPVAWMGTVISFVRKRSPKQGRVWPFVTGLLLMVSGIGLFAAMGIVLVRLCELLPPPADVIVEAMILKTTFSIRGLLKAGREVQSVLMAGDLSAARQLVSWHLVSRETSALSESQVAAATIESLAENTSDSILAPLIFYAVAGLPGALVYRFINTCDAILGYRDSEREWLGKVPARIDDLANLIPARVTAALFICSGTLMGCNPLRSLSVWWRDRGVTASPNAGHPMSAAAGVLCVELEKVGQYRLGRGLRLPDPTDINRVARLLLISTVLACIFLSGFLMVINMSQ
jgi:adenosylcobinamide-phosphate synthase